MKTFTALVVIVLTSAGCREPSGEERAGIEPFPGSAPTLELLGREALRAVVAADTAALESLRLTEHEHNGVIYRELPAAETFPVEMAWENIQLRNRRDRARQLAWFEERDVRYERTFCRGDVRTYETFHALTDCWVAFEDGEHGPLRVQLFKDVVVRSGGHKLVRYYDDPPRRVEAS